MEPPNPHSTTLRAVSTLLWLAVAGAPAFAQGVPESDAAGRDVRILTIDLRDRIEADGVMVRTQHQAVELLTAAGVQAYAQVGVPFLESNQEARLVEIVATKRDGRELDLLSSAPTDVAPVLPLNLPIYSDLRMLRAAVPKLDAGDKLRFSTEVRVRPLAEQQVWTEALFANGLEVERMSYELDLPEKSALQVYVRPGFVARFEERTAGGRRVRRWTVDRPAAGSTAEAGENGPTSAADGKQTPEIQVTSFRSWDDFASWWSALAPPKVDAAVRAKAEELTRGAATPLERLTAIHRFAAQEIQYLALPLGIGRYQARETEEILRSGVGDCKDKVRLVSSLARAAGFEIEPVLIHVGENRDFVTEVPSPAQFDHVIGRTRVGDREIWFDPTSEMTKLGELPKTERGRTGVAVVAQDRTGRGREQVAARGIVVATPERSERPSEMRSETVGSIATDGTTRATLRVTFAGDEEDLRRLFKYGDEAVRREFVSKLSLGWGAKSETKALRFLEPNRLEEAFWFEADIEWAAGGALWRSDDGLLLPSGFVWMETAPEAPESASESQETAGRIQLEQPVRQHVRARFELPEEVRAQAPLDVSIERDFASYRSTYRVEGRTVEVERELTRTVDELSRDRFADLRNFGKLLQRDAEQSFDLTVPGELAGLAESAEEILARCDSAVDDQKYVEAIDLCRRAAELAPRADDVWNSLGIALDRVGRKEEAKAAYERQIELDPHHGFAFANLGLLRWDAGDRAGAETWFRKQIEIAPLESFAYSRLGRLLVDEGRLSEAESTLRNALKLDPGDSRATASLLEALARLGRYAELVRVAKGRRELLTAELGLPILTYLLTLDLEGEALELAPIVEAEARRSAQLLSAGVELPPSEQSIAAVFAVVAAWEIRARIALRDGDLEGAWTLFDAALRFSLSPSAAEGCSRVRRAQGRKADSDRLLAIAVDLAGDDRAKFQRRLAAQVTGENERRLLQDSVREESWRLRSQTRKVSGSAGQQGELWVSLSPDGIVRKATPAQPGKLSRLVRDLEAQPMRLVLPPGNEASLVSKFVAHCSQSEECTFLFEPPVKVWHELRAAAN